MSFGANFLLSCCWSCFRGLSAPRLRSAMGVAVGLGESSTGVGNSKIVGDGLETAEATRHDLSLDSSSAEVSVFERLSSNGADGGVELKSFAAAVGGKGSHELTFFPLADKSKSSIAIPIELAKEAVKSYRSVLYGYFLGPRVPFPIVHSFAKRAWGKFGFNDAMMNENGFFFFRFNDEGGSAQAVGEGPLMIKGVPMFVFPWDPTKGLHKPKHTTCPLWVKLHNIPLVAFNKEGVSRIASALGVPKRMDACTTDMCDKLWGRPGFAKVLVEVWSVGELKRELEVIIPNLKGGEDEKVMIRVEYLWEPSQCYQCCVFGHKSTSCAKVAASNKSQPKPPKVDNNGFMRVERKKWKQKPKQGGPQKKENKNGNSTGEKEKEKEVEDSKQGKEQEVSKSLNVDGRKVSEEQQFMQGKGNMATEVGNPIHVKAPTVASVVKSFRTITKPGRGALTSTKGGNRFQVLSDGEWEDEEDDDSSVEEVPIGEDIGNVSGNDQSCDALEENGLPING